jgi:hypothetical protein
MTSKLPLTAEVATRRAGTHAVELSNRGSPSSMP